MKKITVYKKIRNIWHDIKKLIMYYDSSRCKYKCLSGRALDINSFSKGKYTLIFMHVYGGGSKKYIKDRIDDGTFDEERIIYIKAIPDNYGYLMEFVKNQKAYCYYYPSLAILFSKISTIKVSEILVNSLFEFPNVPHVLKKIIEMKDFYHAKLVYPVHDFHCICPTIHLMDSNGIYCEMKRCDKCNFHEFDINAWRNSWNMFLRKCDSVVAFSEDSKKRLEMVYSDLSVDLIPHKSGFIRNIKRKNKTVENINIALLGELSLIKGFNIIKSVLEIAKINKIPIKFIHFGPTIVEYDLSQYDYHYIETGIYQRDDLPDLMEKYDIDVAFISSVVPETFSYTTQEAIMMGIPVICFDIGAQAEQVRKYKFGKIVPDITAESVLDQIEYMFELVKK